MKDSSSSAPRVFRVAYFTNFQLFVVTLSGLNSCLWRVSSLPDEFNPQPSAVERTLVVGLVTQLRAGFSQWDDFLTLISYSGECQGWVALGAFRHQSGRLQGAVSPTVSPGSQGPPWAAAAGRRRAGQWAGNSGTDSGLLSRGLQPSTRRGKQLGHIDSRPPDN